MHASSLHGNREISGSAIDPKGKMESLSIAQPNGLKISSGQV